MARPPDRRPWRVPDHVVRRCNADLTPKQFKQLEELNPYALVWFYRYRVRGLMTVQMALLRTIQRAKEQNGDIKLRKIRGTKS